MTISLEDAIIFQNACNRAGIRASEARWADVNDAFLVGTLHKAKEYGRNITTQVKEDIQGLDNCDYDLALWKWWIY